MNRTLSTLAVAASFVVPTVVEAKTVTFETTLKDYGGRGYSCFDLEGHVWSFGSYDPWQK